MGNEAAIEKATPAAPEPETTTGGSPAEGKCSCPESKCLRPEDTHPVSVEFPTVYHFYNAFNEAVCERNVEEAHRVLKASARDPQDYIYYFMYMSAVGPQDVQDRMNKLGLVNKVMDHYVFDNIGVRVGRRWSPEGLQIR
jgi:hypothetical protein